MRLIIQGREYPLQDAVQRASLNDIYAMTAQTGLGLSTFGADLEDISTVGVEAALSNPKLLGAMRAMIFLARRYAGEKVTVDQACDFPLLEMSFESDPDDETAEPDPDVPPDPSTGSAPAGGNAAVSTRTLIKPSSRTSGKRSKHA